MRKCDIEYHGRHPAVNVRVYKWLEDGYRDFLKYTEDVEPAFTVDWIHENVPEDVLDRMFWQECGDGWEMIQQDAEEFFGRGVKVYSEGRCGGWAIIDSIRADDVESWDAIALGKWARFSRYAKAAADDVMYRIVDRIYMNREDYAPEREVLSCAAD